jgi:hypothetical protein
MKKTVLGLIFFIIATLSVSAQYIDWGLGLGGGKRSFTYNQVKTNGEFPFDESYWNPTLVLGLKAGFGPLGDKPVFFFVVVEGGMDASFFGFIGGGIFGYPHRRFQLGASLGVFGRFLDLPGYKPNFDEYSGEGNAGFAWNISAGINLRRSFLGYYEFLLGLKYTGAICNFDYEYSLTESYPYKEIGSGNGRGTMLLSNFTLFIRWAFRAKTSNEKTTATELEERRRRERLVAQERQRQLSALEMEEIRRQVREELQSTYPGIDGAIGRAGQKLINKKKKKTRIAVINILSNNGEMSSYVAEELEYQLVSSGKFTMVDRNRLATIRAEQNFQMSGHVSDESAVSIGQMLGANIVLTGSISGVGTSQRLSVSALNVRTGEIVLMVREEF